MFIASTKENYSIANSYLSVEEADKLFASDANSNWKDLSQEVKQLFLKRSSALIDSAYFYKGEKTDDNQLLEFPRSGSKEIPNAVKFALVSVCDSVLKGEAFKSVKSETIGKLSIEYANEFFERFNGFPIESINLLSKFKLRRLRIL